MTLVEHAQAIAEALESHGLSAGLALDVALELERRALQQEAYGRCHGGSLANEAEEAARAYRDAARLLRARFGLPPYQA